MEIKTVNLVPPKLLDSNIKEKITCIRAHRERIFKVLTEIISNKLICHNYGQGGAGFTFLFGCVNRSIREFKDFLSLNPNFKDKPIAIIGAGCYGLLTAIMLTRLGYKIKIYAKETINIPSNKAAGFFFPRPRKCSTQEETAIFLSTGIESYKTYLQIIENKHDFIKAGPKILPAYFSPDIDPGFKPYINLNLIPKPEEVIIDFSNGKKYRAIEYKIVYINPSELMSELNRNIQALNIKITKREVENFEELEEDIIFNCSGLGAKNLAQDKRIVPVQGHLISLKDQKNISNLQYLINFKVTVTNPNGTLRDELIYFAPKNSGILGVTFIRGQDSPDANQHEFDRLLQRCREFF